MYIFKWEKDKLFNKITLNFEDGLNATLKCPSWVILVQSSDHVHIGSLQWVLALWGCWLSSLWCPRHSSQESYWNCACENSQPATPRSCGSHGSPSGTYTATSHYQLLDHHVHYLDRDSSIDTEALWEKPDCMICPSFPTILRTITDTSAQWYLTYLLCMKLTVLWLVVHPISTVYLLISCMLLC